MLQKYPYIKYTTNIRFTLTIISMKSLPNNHIKVKGAPISKHHIKYNASYYYEGCVEASEKKFFSLRIRKGSRSSPKSKGQNGPNDCLLLRPLRSVKHTLKNGLYHIIFIVNGYLYVVN